MKTKKTQAQPADPRLPEGYDGPAFELEDGRVLFAAHYLGHVWAICYLDNGKPIFYRSAVNALEHNDEGHARTALIKYGASKGLKTYRP